MHSYQINLRSEIPRIYPRELIHSKQTRTLNTRPLVKPHPLFTYSNTCTCYYKLKSRSTSLLPPPLHIHVGLHRFVRNLSESRKLELTQRTRGRSEPHHQFLQINSFINPSRKRRQHPITPSTHPYPNSQLPLSH